ncbi:carbohydrate deacetylase isoform X2 [Equus quagga]|uniref:carbohydrate deacetylase isoform X2 n=1 Tax=Equus quagga TaxID=89248 RepID=UPI001EE15CE2|nr:carbohydrate deacetylase isoform X2 [Equus quagga]
MVMGGRCRATRGPVGGENKGEVQPRQGVCVGAGPRAASRGGAWTVQPNPLGAEPPAEAPMARPRVRLVVTADDFGYCPRRDEGIVEAFLAGAVTSVSLLVNGAAAESAAELARRHHIPTGLHANLSEGRPVGPARHSTSSLLSPEGFFLGKMGFREAVAAGDVDLPQVREELEAQLSRFRELLGSDPTHVDGHQHVHVLPGARVPGVRRGAAGLRGALHTAAAGARRRRLHLARGPRSRLRLRGGARRSGRRGPLLPPRPKVRPPTHPLPSARPRSQCVPLAIHLASCVCFSASTGVRRRSRRLYPGSILPPV